MTFKVGISGAGYIFPFHLAAWRAAGAEVVALADPDTARATSRAVEFDIARIHESLEAMLAEGGLDLLDVASPRQMHVTQTLAGLAAGLPVMCQKPVAPTYAEAAALYDRMGAGDRLMVHENWRFRPAFRRIKQWIKAGALGPIRFASISMRTSALLKGSDGTRPAEHRQPFMLSEPRLVLAEVLIHDIDAMRYLLGDLRLVHANGQRTDPELPGETFAALSLTTATDIPVMVSGDMTAYGAPARASDAIEIIGECGRVVLAEGVLSLYGNRPERESYTYRDLLQESADATIAHFIECLQSGSTFETDLRDNLNTLRLVEETYAAIG